MVPDQRRMKLLIDENVPNSVVEFLRERGHEIHLVREKLPAGTPDPVIAVIGDRLSAIVVSWDKDFERLVSRVPHGNKTRFRNLGRITFKCKETHGKAQLQKWITHIELHYETCRTEPDFRMIVEIQGAALKFM
jgi:predicted nuclease of predicted toxin-antitoxin system